MQSQTQLFSELGLVADVFAIDCVVKMRIYPAAEGQTLDIFQAAANCAVGSEGRRGSWGPRSARRYAHKRRHISDRRESRDGVTRDRPLHRTEPPHPQAGPKCPERQSAAGLLHFCTSQI
jgi:hypothetical protein